MAQKFQTNKNLVRPEDAKLFAYSSKREFEDLLFNFEISLELFIADCKDLIIFHRQRRK